MSGLASPAVFGLLAQAGAQRLLDSLVLGSEIAALAWILLRLAPRSSAATRFAVWFSALVAVAAAPLGVGALQAGLLPGTLGGLASAWRLSLPASWAPYLLGAWALLAACGVLRLGSGLRQLRRLRQSCLVIDPAGLPPLARRTVAEFNREAPLQVCVSQRVSVPMAVGFFRPAVILPAWLPAQVSDEELNQILLHEMAHLRRHDDWSNLGQKLLEALLFFHPAAWWIAGQVSLEREMACDDVVLRATGSPRAYAQCLARLAEVSVMRRSLALGQAAVSHLRQTSRRVAGILDGRSRTAARPWAAAMPLLGLMLAGSLVLAEHAPQLVAFQSRRLITAAAASTPAAPVVRASYVLPEPSERPVPIRPAQGQSTASSNSAEKAQRAPARATRAPRLVRAKAPEGPAASGRLVVIAVEDSQFGADGSQLWQIRVWQVVLINPPAPPPVTQKKI